MDTRLIILILVIVVGVAIWYFLYSQNSATEAQFHNWVRSIPGARR